jgi:hypothetical protein
MNEESGRAKVRPFYFTFLPRQRPRRLMVRANCLMYFPDLACLLDCLPFAELIEFIF